MSLPPVLLTASLLALALAAAPVMAEADAPPRRIDGPVEAEVLKVRDGDTVEVAAHVWPMQAVHVAVRLRGVDAPELRGDCAREIAAAEAARDRLVALIGDESVRLTTIEGDKYFGRVVADLSTTTEPDLAARLRAEGLVDPYDGGRRRNWCASVGAFGPDRLRRG